VEPKKNKRKPAAKKKRHPNWGGRRPGAGAPGGNMNALKHGRRSRRMATLGMMLAADPKTRTALLAIAEKWERKQMKVTEVAAEIFSQILERGLRLGDKSSGKGSAASASDVFADPSRMFVGPPVTESRSIETEGPAPNAAKETSTLDGRQEKNSHRPDNQHPRTNPPKRTRSVRENPLD
jgi:hypothetical protein